MPELITEYQNSRTQVDEDTQLAVDKYLEYTENSVLKAKRNFAISIKDYDKDLVRLMQTKQLALADFEEVSLGTKFYHYQIKVAFFSQTQIFI